MNSKTKLSELDRLITEASNQLATEITKHNKMLDNTIAYLTSLRQTEDSATITSLRAIDTKFSGLHIKPDLRKSLDRLYETIAYINELKCERQTIIIGG